jgi:phage baseplate assembly protein W
MKQKYFNYPFKISGTGTISTADEDKHLKDLIEQVLFTDPGERVNLPEFGCGLKTFIFSPNDKILETTLQISITASLQKWLNHLIIVSDVVVEVAEEKLFVTIKYKKIRTGEENTLEFIK